MEYLRRTWASIDLQALIDNYRTVRKSVDRNIYAVVKADAYGHGAPEVALALEKEGVFGFAVSNLMEAQELRKAGIRSPILILGYTPPEYAIALAKDGIAQSVYSLEYAQALNAQAQADQVTVTAHLKLDTGMGRIGLDLRSDDAAGLNEARQILQLRHLDHQGVFTHFSVADSSAPEDIAFTRQQYRRFLDAVAVLESEGHSFRLKHCCNSAAGIALDADKGDAVRAGISLYGLAPSEDVPFGSGYQPVMSLYSAVSMVKTVEENEPVSYGRTYTTPCPRRIATVSAGYADGVPRLLSGRGCVLIHGQRAPIVGRVCMDQFCVDVTDIENVVRGDKVTIFGPGLPVEEVAAAAQTIHYEIICGISKRVPRIYTGPKDEERL